MKVRQLVLIGALCCAAISPASAQQAMYGYPGGAAGGGMMQPMGYYPQAMPAAYMQMGTPDSPPHPQAGYPQTGYPTMAPMDPQQALYGPATPMNGDPQSYGDGGCMSCRRWVRRRRLRIWIRMRAEPGPMLQRRNNTLRVCLCWNCSTPGATTAVISQPTIIDATSGATVASTTDLSFIYEPGLKVPGRILLLQRLGSRRRFLGSMGIQRIQDRQRAATTCRFPAISEADCSINFFDQDQITEIYSSHINNYEDQLHSSLWQHSVVGRLPLSDDRRAVRHQHAVSRHWHGRLRNHQRNRLYGGQLGARTQWQIERFIFDFEGKAGVFANAAHQDQFIVGDLDGLSAAHWRPRAVRPHSSVK